MVLWDGSMIPEEIWLKNVERLPGGSPMPGRQRAPPISPQAAGTLLQQVEPVAPKQKLFTIVIGSKVQVIGVQVDVQVCPMPGQSLLALHASPDVEQLPVHAVSFHAMDVALPLGTAPPTTSMNWQVKLSRKPVTIPADRA